MNSLRFTVAAGLASAAAIAITLAQPAQAGTTVPIDGGGAGGITFEATATGGPRSRADVAAEARAAHRQLNSRSGEQTDAEDTLHLQMVSTRSRDEVRREGIASARSARDVYEGGQSAMVSGQARRPARDAGVDLAGYSR